MNEILKYQPVVVVPAYNRPMALKRLLNSLNRVNYGSENVTLIISLEYGADQRVVQLAEEFEFKHGSKLVKQAKEKLGIKNHIMQCGDLSLEFDSVIVLEDDLFVAPGYYQYACQALEYYDNEPAVAGISLYSQNYNETAQLPFVPVPGPEQVYFMQLASSWGQAWTSNQWINFKKWMETNPALDFTDLPENIQNWPSDSWKKLFNLYLVRQGKYFVYPYRSYTTNNSGFGGKNMVDKGTLFQVPISVDNKADEHFSFPEFHQQPVKYDAFMENNGELLADLLDLNRNEITADLYGTKPAHLLKTYNYIFSSREGGKPVRSFPLELKPPELNAMLELKDPNDSFFYLYEGNQVSKLKKISNLRYLQMADYFGSIQSGTRRYFLGYNWKIIKQLLTRIF